ncbi:SprT-like family protein [uncultured archaeon]|nr:SprT-like family protein [uncultured archaeon]
MKLRWKILLVIAAAALCVYAFGATPRANMKKFYDGYNEEYFANSLPDATVSWGDLTSIGDIAVTYLHKDGTIDIIVDRRKNPSTRQAQASLLHEMCHVATWPASDGPKDDPDHGAKHEACMLRLAEQGAMKGVW